MEFNNLLKNSYQSTDSKEYIYCLKYIKRLKFVKQSNFKRERSLQAICLIALTLTIMSGCKKFVDVDPPQTLLVTSSVFSNSSTATAAQTVIYSEMFNDNLPYFIPMYAGLSGDELTNYSSDLSFSSYYTNSLVATTGSPIWTSGYSYIYQANAVIEGLQNASKISPVIKQQLTGEAKFIRAFWHFYLVNLFGDIPIVTSTNYKTNSTAPRSPKSVVYQQIINDLKDAQNLLNSNYVDASDTATTTDRVRPTKWAATALLAKAYLYNGEWANAESEATTVINNKAMFSLVNDLNEVFLKNSSEAIWQLLPVLDGYNTLEGNGFILTDVPSSGTGVQTTSISDQLLNSFEPGDGRKTNWIANISINNSTYYYPYKYKVSIGSDITEYSMVLRLAEQYLIRAEARAQLGSDLNGAAVDLNVIRNRAGLANTVASTQSTLLSAIFHERQVELFTEWGNRWFDLKRSGNINTIMNTVTPLKGGTWNSNWQLYPIPQSDRDNDHNLTQNPGY